MDHGIIVDGNNLYERRMLVFIETGPQTNKYQQVILDQEHFKNVSDALFSKKVAPPNEQNIEVVTVDLSDEEYLLPDLISKIA